MKLRASLVCFAMLLGSMIVSTFGTTLAVADEIAEKRAELHPWDRHVRGFRHDHNFAMVTGVSSGTWTVKRFGDMTDRSFHHSGVLAKFQYSFHLPIYRGFGYFLGSSVGYHYESADSRQPFRPVAATLFPSVLSGLVLNVNPAFRLGGGLEVYLERHDGLSERDGVNEDVEISITMQTFDLNTFIDIFYDLTWAFRLEGHARLVQYQSPKDSDGHAVNARLGKSDTWFGVGLLYHLL